MLSGERQVSPTLDGVRRDHVARYEWAAQHIPEGAGVLDVACGVGYGSDYLAGLGYKVRGVEIDTQAIAYAERHYGRARYSQADVTKPGAFVPFRRDVHTAIAFECLEHFADPAAVLRVMPGAQLLCSVPNQTHFPHRPEMNLHHRHYTEAEFRALLEGCNWQVEEIAHQHDALAEVGDTPGRTLVARCTRRTGKHIAILGMGPSLDAFTDMVKRLGGASAYCDEVWGINALGDVFDCDRVFHMDDVRVQMARAEAKPLSNIARMVDWMRDHPGPIYTSHVEPGFRGLVRYPLEEVVGSLGEAYFNSTTPYAVALALWEGASRISVFGCDYSYAHSHSAEKGRACLEYWLAIAKRAGVRITVPRESSLFDACENPQPYGYDGYTVTIGPDMSVHMTPRDLPTAEEIEARYDHSQPTSWHVRNGEA